MICNECIHECVCYRLDIVNYDANNCGDFESSRRKGHWIHLRCDMYECSECGKIHTSFEIDKCDANYCPKCGTEME